MALTPGIAGLANIVTVGVRTVHVRDGRLYEGDAPLRVRSNSDGLFVGCTFVTWEAFEEIKRRALKLRGQE